MKKIIFIMVLLFSGLFAEEIKIPVYDWRDLDFFNDYVVLDGEALIGKYTIKMPSLLEETKVIEKFHEKLCKDGKIHPEMTITWNENYEVVEVVCSKKK